MYLTPYTTDIFKMSVTAAAALAVFRIYVMQFLGGPLGGVLADKVGSTTRIVKYCFIVMIAALILFMVVPVSMGAAPLMVATVILCIGLFAMRGIYFATLDEVNIPLAVTGTAIGIVSVIGFLPDVFMNVISGHLIDTYPGAQGYRYIFAIMIAAGVIGLIATIMLGRTIKKQQSQVTKAE